MNPKLAAAGVATALVVGAGALLNVSSPAAPIPASQAVIGRDYVLPSGETCTREVPVTAAFIADDASEPTFLCDGQQQRHDPKMMVTPK